MRDDAPHRSATLHVRAEIGTELTLLDHSLHQTAREITTLTGRFRPGLYKLRARAGHAFSDQVVELAPDRTVSLDIPRLALRTAAPLAGSAWAPSRHLQAAADESRGPVMQQRHAASIFVFVRLADEATLLSRTLDSFAPLAGLSLSQEQGQLLESLASRGRQDLDGAEPWGACRLEVAPGQYRLRSTVDASTALEQTIVASEGWQTQVFLEKGVRRTRGAASDTWQVIPPQTAIFMSPLTSGFVPDNNGLRMAEIARCASADREWEVLHAMLAGLTDLSAAPPTLLLFCLSSFGWNGASTRPGVKRLISALEVAIPDHPDLTLLAWIAQHEKGADGAGPGPIALPPMLARTWSLMLGGESGREHTVARGSTAAMVATHLVDGGSWLAWLDEEREVARNTRELGIRAMAQRVGLTGFIERFRVGARRAASVEEQLVKLAEMAAARPKGQDWHELSDAGEALMLALRPRRHIGELRAPVEAAAGETRDVAPSIDQLAQTLGLPRASIESLIGENYEKLVVS